MRTLALISLSMVALGLTSASFGEESAKLKTVYRGKLPWGKDFSVKIYLPEDWNDPGHFSELNIFKGQLRVFTLKAMSGEKISQSVDKFPAGTKSLGEYMKVVPLTKDHQEKALFLSNWVGGSDDNEIIILGIDHKSNVYLSFKESVHLAKIADFDGDGKYDLLKKGGRGEPSRGRSYDPYLVYKQVVRDGVIAFVLDEELSKKWSAQNQFEWHGPEYNEKLDVDEHGKIIKK